MDGIKIIKTTPRVTEDKLFSLRRCYMGISLDNPVFSGESLSALVNWATIHFDHCLVVLGDYLRRFNETILNGLEGDDAVAAAVKVGDDFIEETKGFFASVDKDKVTLIRWKPCLESDEYKNSRDIIDTLYNQDDGFRAAVQRDAFSFLKRQEKRGQDFAVSTERAIELSSSYLLEEIAVFSALSRKGWKVELYPGPELEVLVDIASGQYTEIPPALKERVNVELGMSKHKG